MGTQTSNPGPGDRQPLLPSWATQPMVVPSQPVTPVVPIVPNVPNVVPAIPAAPSLPTSPVVRPIKPPPSPAPKTPPPPVRLHWSAAKRSMRSFAKTGSRRYLGRAARAYVRAKGGSRRAARAASAGRKATVRLGSFLADVARHGLKEAAERIGIASGLGQDAETVFVAIVDAIAPAGAAPEQTAARAGVSDALWHLYDELSLQDDVFKIDAVDASTAAKAIETAVVAVIINRWLQEVGIGLEERATSSAVAVRRERDLKDYVRRSVHLDLKDVNVLEMNWQSAASRQFIEDKYAEAYAVFEV